MKTAETMAKQANEKVARTVRGTKSTGETGGAGEAGGEDEAGETGSEGAKGAKSAEGSDEDKVIDVDSLTGIIETAVKSQIDEHLKASDTSITTEQVSECVKTALEAQAKASADSDSKTMSQKAVGDVVGAAIAGALDKVKIPAKSIHSAADANNLPVIEVPVGDSAGNLPLYSKQLLNVLMRKDRDLGIDAGVITKGVQYGDRMFARAKQYGAKALTSTGAGTGDEFVPTDLSSELLRRLYVESTIAQMLMASEIAMPTNPYKFPLSTTRAVFKLEAVENTAATASDPGTDDMQLDAKKLMALVEYSYEADEDSIVPILPLILQLLSEAAADALEDAIINGDTGGTHQDSDTNGVSKHVAKSFDGLRKLSLAVAGLKKDITSGGINRANCLVMLKAMGAYGKRKKDLIWLTSTAGETDFLGLDDVVTADKRGAAGTSVTGELASYFGIPIVSSGVVRDDLNASGVYDGSTTTKGALQLVNLSRFRFGSRRGFTVESDKNISTQKNQIVASFRKAFKPIETPSATVQSVVIGYNFTA